jgi:hypothetical protein
VSSVWSILLPKLVERGLNIRFTDGADGEALRQAGTAETMHRVKRGGAIPFGLRRFVPYTQNADLSFPTYLRPCSNGTRNTSPSTTVGFASSTIRSTLHISGNEGPSKSNRFVEN